MARLSNDEFLASFGKRFERLEEPDEKLSFEDAPTSRQIGFGYFGQGTTSVGGLGRIIGAGIDTFNKGGDFELNAKLKELERQQGIFEEYPEFAGITPDQYTTAMKLGEGLNYVIDLPSLIPFAGGTIPIRALALGLGEASGEVARQVGSKGKVEDPASVAIVGGLGALGSVGGDLLARGIKKQFGQASTKEVEEKAKTLLLEYKPTQRLEYKPSPSSPPITQIEDLTPVLSQADHVRAWWKKSYQGQQTQLSQLRQQVAEGKNVPQADFVRAFWKASGAERNKVNATPLLTDVETNNIRQSVASLKTSSDSITAKEISHQQKLINISRVDRNIKGLEEKLKNPINFDAPKITKELKTLKNEKIRINTKVLEESNNISKLKADAIADTIEDLAQKGQLTDNVFGALMAEAVRPIVGAAGGGIIGNMFDDDSDHNWMYYGLFAGAGFGVLSKRLNKSPHLTQFQKNNGEMVINEAYHSLAGRAMAKLKIMTSSTIATKMDAAGGWSKAIGNKLFSRIGAGDVNSLEAKVQRLHSQYFERLNSISVLPETKNVLQQIGSLTEASVLKMNEANKTVNTVAGEVMRGFIDINSVQAGYKGLAGNLTAVTDEQLPFIREAVLGYKSELNKIKNLVQEAGIPFKDLGENYGLPQLWNIEKANNSYASFVKDLETAISIQKKNGGRKLNAENFATNVTTRPAFKDTPASRRSDFFKFDKETGQYTFRNEAIYFENTRKLTDKEAVKFLAEKGWLKLDAQEVLTEYGLQTIKVAEFAKAFGAKGELINDALKATKESFKKAAIGKNANEQAILDAQRKSYEDLIVNGIEAFWGRYGKPLQGEIGQTATTSVRTLQALANMNYLTTVAIANLPDLLQPFINSGFGSAAKVLMQRPFKPSFSGQGTFKYDSTWERELMNFTSGGMIDSRGQAFLANVQDIYFKGVGLKKVTSAARNFAYDVGVNRVYSLSKKTKLSNSELKELKSMGLTKDNLTIIRKHKTVEDAFADTSGANVFLDMAGRQSADRDAIIPLIGNRLLFTQHHNPFIRSMGQFLSWTMAKSAQLNKILSRVEDGDAKLALKMIATIPIYAGLREMKGFLNPSAKEDPYEDEDYIDKAFRGLRISGQANNWAIDKIAEAVKYNISSPDNFFGGISPAIGYMEESIKTLTDAAKKDDLEDAAKKAAEIVPIVSQGIDLAEKYAVGGEVDVPRAAPEPDERIDKMTGLPYNIQAGIPFRDEEDPIKRLGLAGGGMSTDPMQRLGFVVGGLTPIIKGLLKGTDEAVGAFESTAAKNLANVTPDGSVDDVAKSLDKNLTTVYHQSDAEFDTFLMEKIGTGQGNQNEGYGIFLSSEKNPGTFYGKNQYTATLNLSEDKMLDYDLPLKDQSEYVKNALLKIDDDPDLMQRLYIDPRKSNTMKQLIEGGRATGESLTNSFRTELRGRDKVSELLNQVGIKATKYITKEMGTEGTRSYVVFDPSLIKITGRTATERNVFPKGYKPIKDAGTVIKPLDDIPPNESVPNIVKNLDKAIKQYEKELKETKGTVDIKRINQKYKIYFDEIKRRKLLDKIKRADRKGKYGDKVTSIIEFFEENPKKSAAVAAGLPTAFANRVEPNYADE